MGFKQSEQVGWKELKMERATVRPVKLRQSSSLAKVPLLLILAMMDVCTYVWTYICSVCECVWEED